MKILSRFLATVFLGTAAVAMVLRGEDVTGKVAVSDGLGDTQAAASADHNTIGRPDRGKEVRAPGAVENIPISTDLHTRAPATHDDDRLVSGTTETCYFRRELTNSYRLKSIHLQTIGELSPGPHSGMLSENTVFR